MLQPFRFPEGSRVVHIGPHKTGTTAVQFAFHEAREAVAAHGVHYVGPQSQTYLPALGLTGLPGRLGGPRGTESDWQGAVDEVRAQGAGTTLMSSESFANAEPKHIARLADDLDPERLQVVRMVRRYDKMLPSQWQQQISGGGRRGYRSYLDRVLADSGHDFWRRHGFVPLTRTWLEQVGPEHLTVVVVNEDDRGWLLRVFEQFVGLPHGTLQPPADRENRSLTRSEVEILRGLNRIRKESGWVPRTHFEYVRRGVSVALRGLPVDPEGGRITLPPSLVDEVAERTRADLAGLAGLGVRVVGSTDWLTPTSTPDPTDDPTFRPSVSLTSAAAAVGSVVDRAEAITPFALTKTTPEDSFRPPPPAKAHHQHRAKLPPVDPVAPRTQVRLVPTGPAAAALLAQLPPPAAYASSLTQGRTLQVDRPPAPTRRAYEVLVLAPPHEELLHGWQQHLLRRGTEPLERWLANQPGSAVAPLVREVHGRCGDRGVEVLIVGVDHAGPLARHVAGLLDLPPRVLRSRPAHSPRRAVLDHAELEVVRRLNEGRWSDAAVSRYVHRGAVSWLREGVGPHDDDVTTLPVALQDRSSQEATRLLAALADTGVTVVGDPGLLLPPSPVTGATRLDPSRVAVAVAGALARTDPRRPGPDSGEPPRP